MWPLSPLSPLPPLSLCTFTFQLTMSPYCTHWCKCPHSAFTLFSASPPPLLSLFIRNKISEFTTCLFSHAGDLICTQLAAHNCFTALDSCQKLKRLLRSGDCSSCSVSLCLCLCVSLSPLSLSLSLLLSAYTVKRCACVCSGRKEKVLLLVDLLDWRTFMSKYCISVCVRREDRGTLKEAYSLLLQITVQWTSSISTLYFLLSTSFYHNRYPPIYIP